MKTMSLLFLTISWAAFTPRAGYAVQPGPLSQPASPGSSANPASGHPYQGGRTAPANDGRDQAGRTASEEQRRRGRFSGASHPLSPASLAKVNRPQQRANNRQRSQPGVARSLYQLSSDKSGGAAKGGSFQNEAFQCALPVRTSSVVRPGGPSLNNMRHCGANPAVVGGWANSDRRNTGAISGTRMGRKP